MIPLSHALWESVVKLYSVWSEQVKWSNVMDRSPDPPTAVFLHGILGSRKNWGMHLTFWVVLNSFLNVPMLAE